MAANATKPASAPAAPAAPANGTKAANGTAPAKAPAPAAPANGTKAANGTDKAAANATKPAGTKKKSSGAGFAPGAGSPTPAEADAVAAEADGEKADVMYRFAKKKVDDLIAGIQALDSHIKNEFLALEKILKDIEIDATFDPESAADIAWITTEISKILEDSP